MRYLKEEWVKLKSQKSFLIITLIFILLIAISLYIFINKDHYENNPSYIKELNNLSNDYNYELEKYSKLNDELNSAENYQMYLAGYTFIDYSEEDINNYNKYKCKIDLDPNFLSNNLMNVISPMIDNLEYALNIEDNIDKTANNLKERLVLPIYKEGSFQRESIIKKANNYNDLSNKKLYIKIDRNKGFYVLKDLQILDLLILIYIFLIGLSLIQKDRDYDLNSILSSINKGLKHSSIAKIFLILIISLLVSFIIWGLTILIISIFIGYGDLNRSIQSIQLFNEANLTLNIKEFLFYFLIYKIIGGLLITSLLLFIISFIKNDIGKYLSLIIVLALSYLSYKNISEISNLAILKYISIFSIIDSFSILSKLEYVNVFNVAIDRKIFSIYFVLFMSLILIILSIIKLSGENEASNRKVYINKFEFINFKKVFSSELYRHLFQYFGIFLIIIFIIFAFSDINKNKYEPFNEERQLYLQVYSKLKGKINENTISKLENMEEEYSEIDEIYNENEEKFENKEIDKDAYLIKKAEIESLIRQEEKFNEVKNQVYSSIEKTKSKDNLYLIDEKIGNFWFKENVINNKMQLILSISIILFVTYVTFKDYEIGMDKIVKSTRFGHIKITKSRIIFTIIIATILTIIFSSPKFISGRYRVLLLNGEALVQSIPNLVDFDLVINFNTLFIFILIYRIFSIINMGLLNLYLANKTKSRWITYIICGIIFIIPLFVLDKFIGYVPILNAFYINTILWNVNVFGFLIYVIINVIIFFILSYLIKREWKKVD